MSNRDSQIAKFNALVASGQLCLGMLREEVKALLGSPDDTGALSRNGVPTIYKYGFVELGFGKRAKDGLVLIYVDEGDLGDFVLILGAKK